MLTTNRLLLVVNVDTFFLSHRLPIALEAIKKGWEVYLLTADTGQREKIESYGIFFRHIPFERSGKNPIHELRCIHLLAKYYRELEPSIIHHVTLKAALLGGIAAKISRKKSVVNAISGMGYNFTDGRNGFLQRVIKSMMKLAFLSRDFCFILQNPDDVALFQNLKFVPPTHIFLIKGSGVDLRQYAYSPKEDSLPIRILFPARMLYDKGLQELIDAAISLRERYEGQILFSLAGFCDPDNLAGVKEDDLKSMLIPDYIEWIGYCQDMVSQYKSSDIVVLPSYREGLPKSLIEAAAVGRPIVTTNVPGCKECVIPKYNGELVSAKSSSELASALELLINSSELRKEYGNNSRVLAEQQFSLDAVLSKTFDVYSFLLDKRRRVEKITKI